MKKIALLAAASAVLVAFPALAAQVNPGDTGITIDPFDGSTRGTQLVSSEFSGQALTFGAIFRSAVYQNTLGTLDFYYQVAHDGAGSTGANNIIQSFTAAEFDGFKVDAYYDPTDFDGMDMFTAENNPGPFTSTANRSFSGEVIGADFGANGLNDHENTATYIFRTNATRYTEGTFGVIDGSALQGDTYAPMSAVPEPASWALMIGGFAMAGMATRRSRRPRRALA